MDRLKKARRPLRSQQTKTISECEAIMALENPDRLVLGAKLTALKTLREKIETHDEKIEDLMADIEIEEALEDKELEDITSYKESFLLAQAKILSLIDPVPVVETTEYDSASQMSRRGGEKRNFRLPKFNLKKFNGDHKEWLGWWSLFQKIDQDQDIHQSDKIQYLADAMEPGTEAAELVNSYLQTADSYPEVIKALKERFGREDLLLQVYLRELLTLVISNVTSKDKIPLPKLYLKLESHLRSMAALNMDKADPSTWLFPLVESSLSEETLRAWQRYQKSLEDRVKADQPKTRLEQLMEFIKIEVRSEQQISLAQSGFQTAPVPSSSDKKQKSGGTKASKVRHEEIATAAGLTTGQAAGKCAFCEKGHDTDRCGTAMKMTLEERKQIVKDKNLCFACLRKGHSVAKCRTFVKCPVCGGKHYAILCNKLAGEKEPGGGTQRNKSTASENPPVSGLHTLSLEDVESTASNSNRCSGDVLLQTIKVTLIGGEKPITVRLVGDSGSQRSYIKTSTLNKIKRVHVGDEWLQNVVFGGTTTKPELTGRFQVSLRHPEGGTAKTFEVLEKHQLCGKLPKVPLGPWVEELKRKGIIISDVGQGCEDVDMLIGNDLWGSFLTETPIVKVGALYAQETIFGWTLAGRLPTTTMNAATTVINMISTSTDLSTMWSLEALGIRDPIEVQTEEELDREAQAKFSQTVRRDAEGRYVVALPWKTEPKRLPTNHHVAVKRLESATGKLKKDGKWGLYNDVFKSWEREGLIHRMTNDNKEGHYLPHRPVFKNSVTTPVRPVFDASCRQGQHPSLNDCLHKGPNLLEIIPAIMLRFRENPVGVTADIRKAFQMLRVRDEDQQYQKFLWWEGEKCEKLITFQHDRVVFGMNCSPYLLGASINNHLDHCAEDLQGTAMKLKESYYVDNSVTSVSDTKEYDKFKEESTAIMKDAMMELRQWARTLKEDSGIGLSTDDECGLEPNKSDLSIETEICVSVLGLLWDRQTDMLSCNIEDIGVEDGRTTKRQVLSAVSKIFDPLGFLCPATLLPKLILQDTWSRKLGWDEALPEELAQKFSKWIREAPMLGNIKIPRHIQFDNPTKREVHIFNDACQYGYGSVVFLRTEFADKVKVEMLMAKARLAPLKKNTIPRLELTACLVGARLGKVVKSSLKLDGVPFRLHTDSTTAKAWIQRNLDVGIYIANRKAEILTTTKASDWRFVPGESNPADLISRGCSPRQLLESNFQMGPDWLKLPEEDWPTGKEEVNEEAVQEEIRKTASCFASITDAAPPFSSYRRNAAVYGWVIRFINALKKKLQNNEKGVYLSELRSGEKLMIREIQSSFQKDKKEDFGGLQVKMHDDGLLRVTTRLGNRKDVEGFKYPILLPKNHPLVDMLIMDFHKSFCHAGVQTVMTGLREKYWIIQSRRTIRRVLNKCSICKRFKSKPLAVDPVALPEKRVQDSEAFETTGVDLAGPLFLKNGDKVWVVLYTCAVYRCVHLDLVESLSTEAFMKSLERFISSCGRPNTIFSDNGTNFVGAKNIFKSLDWKEITMESGLKQIVWRLNPPTAAWWGGWWEKLVHVMKELLKRMLGRAHLTLDGLRTCLAGVCATMNQRPLTAVTEDSDDLIPLTPSMFMRGKCVGFLPEAENSQSLSAAYRKMKNVQKQIQDRFRKEYLCNLVQKHRGKVGLSIQVGDVVLVGADNRKRFDWPLGRVERVFPGKDGNVRVADVRTKSGILTRPLQRLYHLEVNEGHQRSPGNKEVLIENEDNEKKIIPDKEKVYSRSGRLVKRPARYGQCLSFVG